MISAKRENSCRLLQDYKYWLFILIFFGCTSVKFSKTMPGQPQASYYSFSKDAHFGQLANIDTTMLYVNGKDWVRTYQSKKIEKLFSYQFLKFNGNGTAFFSGDSKEAFNGINIYDIRGQFCYYKIEDGELRLELFDHNLKKFTIMYAKVYPDSIHFYRDRLRIPGGGKDKLNLTYSKTSIKFLQPLAWPE
jgi:hypothetical protein